MFKALIKTSIWMVILFANMTLVMWCINHFDWGNDSIEKTLISNVLAEATSEPYTPVPVIHGHIALPKPTLNYSTPLRSVVPHKEKTDQNQQIVINFNSTRTQLEEKELLKFKNLLNRFNVSPSHIVRVLAGPAPSENHIQSPQNAKLRAQAVARIIYPYTQNVKMFYRPSLEMGVVIVEFSQPHTNKNI